jgi:hypothetical protein
MDQRRIGDSSLLTPQELEWLEQNPQSVASATTSSIATRPVALEPSRTYCQIYLQSGASHGMPVPGGLSIDPMARSSLTDAYGYPYGSASGSLVTNMAIPLNPYDVAETGGRVHGPVPSAPATIPHRVNLGPYQQYGVGTEIALQGVQIPTRPPFTSSAAAMDEAVPRSVEIPRGGAKRHIDQSPDEVRISKRPLLPYIATRDSGVLNDRSYPASYSAYGTSNGYSTYPHSNGTPFSGRSNPTQSSPPISGTSSAAHLPISASSSSVPQQIRLDRLYEHTKEKAWYAITGCGEFEIRFRSPSTSRKKAEDDSRTDRRHGVSSVETKVSTLSREWKSLVRIMEKYGVQNIPATPAFLQLTGRSKLISVRPLRCLNDIASKLAVLVIPSETQSEMSVRLPENFINDWCKSLASVEAQVLNYDLALLIVTKLELRVGTTMTSCEELKSVNIGILALDPPYMKYYT